MADVVSPLDEHLTTGRFGRAGQPAVSLSEVTGHGLFQLAAWPHSVANVADIGAKGAGASKAPGPGEASTGDKGALLRIEPLKWWLIAEGQVQMAPPLLPPKLGHVLDLSHARTWLKIGGEKAEMLLNHYLPINLHTNAFPSGSVASTAFHHVGVTLWRSDSDLNLLLPRSFAASLWQMLEESALQYGLDVS